MFRSHLLYFIALIFLLFVLNTLLFITLIPAHPSPFIFTLIVEFFLGATIILLVKSSRKDTTKSLQVTPPLETSNTQNTQVTKPIQEDTTELTHSDQQNIRYEAVLANIGDGLVVSDKKGIIMTFNKAAETMLGWKAEEVIGQHLQDIVLYEYVNDKGNNKLLGNTTPELNNPTGEEQTLFFLRKDKTKFPAALKVTSYVAGDQMLGTITLFRDTTVETNADKMKSEFIALASHQLKTPLSTMRWYLAMLIDGDFGQLTPEQLKFVLNIKTATFRMIDLVSALLNISRIESGRIVVAPKPTDLRTVIADVLQDVRQKINSKNQKLEIAYPDNLTVINLDPRLIRQVYLNLLTNASKYSPENSTILLKLSLTDTDVITQVTDQGFGIPKADREKVFEKFYRGENVIAHVADGTGLGLFLVKAIIELSSGKIWFESHTKEELGQNEQQGTTFWFSLPLSGMPARKGVVILDGWDKM